VESIAGIFYEGGGGTTGAGCERLRNLLAAACRSRVRAKDRFLCPMGLGGVPKAGGEGCYQTGRGTFLAGGGDDQAFAGERQRGSNNILPRKGGTGRGRKLPTVSPGPGNKKQGQIFVYLGHDFAWGGKRGEIFLADETGVNNGWGFARRRGFVIPRKHTGVGGGRVKGEGAVRVCCAGNRKKEGGVRAGS